MRAGNTAPSESVVDADTARELSRQRLLDVVSTVPDPEIPVITLGDLGIVRQVEHGQQGWIVELTPTYSGCPATEVIRDDVIRAARDAGFEAVQVRLVLSPAWTTRWISAEGRQKLRDYGIAPPSDDDTRTEPAPLQQVIRLHRKVPTACPQCGSTRVELLSEFGSTPCKSLHRCLACREPFDYFKPY